MGYYLWGQGSSGNHGNEDWIRGTCRLLAQPPELITARPEEELRYGIGNIANLTDRLPERTGGRCLTLRVDNAELLAKSGLRPVLWGWAGMGTSRSLARKMARFDSLVVAEEQSLSVLQSAGLSSKVRLGPDPSFLVERQLRPLGGAFRRDTVGLCLSALGSLEPSEGLLYRSYQRLIRYIMTRTDYHVALIPYCVRRGRDDTLLHIPLERHFRGWSRVVCRTDGSCQVLRGDISLCRWVVGSEGAIAAWSCGVPALCVGATPRATGLAKMLHSRWEDVVVPVSTLKDEEELTRRFRKFLRQEDRLRRELETNVRQHRQRALDWQWESSNPRSFASVMRGLS